MEIFTNLWNNWASYEKLLLGILLLIILFVIPALMWIFTKNKRFALVSLLSILISGVLVCITFLVANLAFDLEITDIFKVVPFITIFTITLGLGTAVGYLMQNRKRKDFAITEIQKEVKKDNIKLSISMLLLLLAVGILSPALILPLCLSLGDALISLWLMYILICKMIK